MSSNPGDTGQVLGSFDRRVIYTHIETVKKLINLCWSTGCFVKLHFTPRDDFIEGFSTANIQDLAGLPQNTLNMHCKNTILRLHHNINKQEQQRSKQN